MIEEVEMRAVEQTKGEQGRGISQESALFRLGGVSIGH
jgi:hypothetical protein